MARCKSCEGIIGVDCFNPSECEYIAHQQEIQKEYRTPHQIHFLEGHIDALEAEKVELLEALKRFVNVCDSANPMEFVRELGSCVEPARQAIAKAEGRV